MNSLLEEENLTAFAARLPGPDSAPTVIYRVGQGYLMIRNFETAGARFKYVLEHFPQSPYTEGARAGWLQCRGEQLYKSPAETVAECKAFLKEYPQSPYANRI